MNQQSPDNDSHQRSGVVAARSDQTPVKSKKLRRIRACDFCHRRSIRCKPSVQTVNSCQNCVDFGLVCAYERPIKKRGVKVASLAGTQSDVSTSLQKTDAVDASQSLTSDNSNAHVQSGLFQFPPQTSHVENLQHIMPDISNATTVVDSSDRTYVSTHHVAGSERVEADEIVGFALSKGVRDMVLTSRDKIAALVDVYFSIVYPIFPLFHKGTLLKKMTGRVYLQNQAFFCSIMAVCSLASARVRDGALSGRWDPKYFEKPAAELFVEAAEETMPRKLVACRDFDSIKACALLALFGVQIGDTGMMHQYLGMYHALVFMDGLHDEKNWPSGIGVVETEERRRLFWSMYTLEVYCSIVWAGIIRCRESQSRVAYPNEIDDEFFSDKGFSPGRTTITAISPHTEDATDSIMDPSCWLHGWNFTTELYRVLEHAMEDLRRKRPTNLGPFTPSDLFLRDTPSQSTILEKVMSMHMALPDAFKKTRNMVNEMSEDIFGYQAANITATLQLVRMVLFTTQDATTNQKCAIANELLDAFSNIPLSFLRAISSPLLYHLAGIGSILGQVIIKSPLSESAYLQVRTALLNMADLLASLEDTISRSVGAAARLRNLTTGIDNFMTSQRQQESYASSHSSSLPNMYHTSDSHMQSSPRHALMSVNSLISRPEPDYSHVGSAQWNDSHQQPIHHALSHSAGSQDMPYPDLRNTGEAERLEFQIPPELLEDWPWPLHVDVAQDLQVFSGFLAPGS